MDVNLGMVAVAALAAFLGGAPSTAQTWLRSRPGSHEVGDDGAVVIQAPGASAGVHIVVPADPPRATALRLEVLPPKQGKREWIRVREVRVIVPGGGAVALGTPTASAAPLGFPATAATDRRSTSSWHVDVRGNEGAELVLPFRAPLSDDAEQLRIELELEGRAARLRVSLTDAPGHVLAEGADLARSALQGKIHAAIDLGVDHLLATQLLDGSWAHHQPGYESGGTALCTYALLKSGLPPDHLSIRRALAYLERTPPKKTYEAGCVLMLYAALDDPAYTQRAREVLELLLGFQSGDFGYARSSGHRDLSNTQYGALALWAAERLGLDVPEEAWRELAMAVVAYREATEGPISDAVGFGYRPGSKATGSMGTAGVGVLKLCEQYLGGKLAPEARRALNQGLAWLDAHFRPNSNPFGGWVYYYLYGVERVGAFTDTVLLNGMDWYFEGARWIVGEQNVQDGGWPKNNSNTVDTSFALLFLERATSPTSGAGASRGTRTYGTDDPAVAVNIRAAGDTPLSLWISSWGDDVIANRTFAGEEGKGPRVASVEYFTSGGVLLPGAREGGSEWMWIAREPKPGWEQPGYDERGWKPGLGGFGSPGSPNLVVRTPWERDELWLRTTLEVDPARLFDPRLELVYGVGVDPSQAGPRGELVKLFDEEAGFAKHLEHRPGGAKIELVDGGASGEKSLRVEGRTVSTQRVPRWAFPIREEPGEGEFRYLRFAWKTGSAGVRLDLAFDGEWRRALRYTAGEVHKDFERDQRVVLDEHAPRRWERLTVDLFAGLKGQGLLTGIGLTPMEGVAEFDGVYLARTERAFRKVKALRDGEPAWARPAPPPPPGRVEVWLNGARVVALDRETGGMEVVLEGDPLRDALRPGDNQVAVYARNDGRGRAVDVALRDLRLLASIGGDAQKPAGDARFPARVSFPRPGGYDIQARVLVADAASGGIVALESPPLRVRIANTSSPELVQRSGRPAGDLVAGNVDRLRASSAVRGSGAEKLLDGRMATGWRSVPGDLAPSVHLELKRGVKVDTLTLSTLSGTASRPLRVRVVIDGDEDEPIVHEIDPDPLHVNRVPLGRARRVRSVEVLVLERTVAGGKHPSVGFAELDLVLEDG